MQKYKPIKQISKSPFCLLYTASHIQTNHIVLVKRIKKLWYVGYNPEQQEFYLHQIIEVIKNKKYFQIVFQNPNGISLGQSELIAKLQPQKFYSILAELTQAFLTLKKFKANAYVLPQWIFVSKSSTKILHFEPFLSESDDKSQKHVYMYNLQKRKQCQNINLVTSQGQNPSFSTLKNTDLVFNIGCIAYSLLMGKNPLKCQTHDEYLTKVNDLADNCQMRVSKMTKDQKLIKMIVKMVGKNPFNAPSLQEVRNYFKRNNELLNKNKKQKQIQPLGVQFEMQKIMLSRIKNSSGHRKFIRQCCKTFQDEQINGHKSYHLSLHRVSNSLTKKRHNRAASLLPKLSISTNRHKINFQKESGRFTQDTRPTAFRSEQRIDIKQT